MSNPFNASHIKIKTAKRHRDGLTHAIEQYQSMKAICLVLKPSKDFKEDYWRYSVSNQPPDDLTSYIGDCIHNLRSALDAMAVSLVDLNHNNTNKVYFPFANEEADFEKMIKMRNFHRAAPEAIELIKKLKPYKGGNAALRALHDFDIDDKHKGFIPVTSVTMLPNLQYGGINMQNTISSGVVHNKGFMRAPRNPQYDWFTKLPVEFRLDFPFESVFSQMEVLPTISQLINDVSSIVDSFEALSFGDQR